MWRIYSAHNVLFILHRVTGLALLTYLFAHIFRCIHARCLPGRRLSMPL